MTTESLPRNQSLPLFNPHVAAFVCTIEALKLPAIDAQADSWFLEARALESPETVIADRDQTKIVQLTRQAAERGHWKAALNLASMYIEGRDPTKGVEDAVQLVEKAMVRGIPAAYDRMGTYYMNGTGVNRDATMAFAFWQKAAELGNPQAMTVLGEKLNATSDSSDGTYWANIPVAKQMLECALSQGHGPAAYYLSFTIAGRRPPAGITDPTTEEKARAISVLHHGLKLGCLKCGRKLSIEFGDPFDLSDMLAPHIDKARGERYGVLRDAIDFDPDIRFPNLDRVVPLPPGPLPAWNGDRDTLINAAMGVKPKTVPPRPTTASTRTGREFLDAAFHLRQTGETTSDSRAPSTGYWQPTGTQQPPGIRLQLSDLAPVLYNADEAFRQLIDQDDQNRNPIFGVVWERLDTKWHNDDAIEPRGVNGLIREVVHAAPIQPSSAGRACTSTGIWQPWVDVGHPLRAIVNQHWRQIWLTKGERFPEPARDWLLPVPAEDITWHLIDDASITV